MVAVSKRFISNQKYTFTTASAFSTDGGVSWQDSADLWLDHEARWIGYSDPTLAWDIQSNLHLASSPIVEVVKNGKPDIAGRGMFAFRSVDGGVGWQAPPKEWDSDDKSDKQWMATDTSPESPYLGSVYACWGALTPLRFARSADHGASWQGVGSMPAGAPLTSGSVFAPAICASGDGTIHVAWHNRNTRVIHYIESTDGGESFSETEVVVRGIKGIDVEFFTGGSFAVFPGGTFRVMTLVTIAPLAGHGCVIAWSDCREGISRIYYRVRDVDGTWAGDDAGRPLLANIDMPHAGPMQHFHPQLAVNESGLVGCAFYEFGEKRPDNVFRIDVKIASTSVLMSGTYPVEFFHLAKVTDQAWDPAVDAPLSHGNTSITFIGEYFGLEASGDDFCVLWTDTRTGKQELWFSRVKTFRDLRIPGPHPNEVVGFLEGGIARGGGGYIWIKGVRHPVPPRSDRSAAAEIQRLIAAHEIVTMSTTREGRAAAQEIMRTISKIAAGAAGPARKRGT